MSLYEILGVSRSASQEEIRENYKKLVVELHPDKPNGDAEKFKQVQSAYEVLRNPEKRQMYDITGMTEEQAQEGPPPGFGGGMPFGMGGFPFSGGGGFTVDMSDFFGGMFGAGGPRRKQTVKRPKGPNKVHDIALSLKDFYFGKKMRFDLERQVFCSDCSGDGCLNWKTCNECKGNGVKEVAIQIGPGMVAMNRGPCSGCSSEGRLKGTSCKTCEGKGLLNKKNVLEAEIKAGAPIGDVLVFGGMCSDMPEFEHPGDVLIRLQTADEELDIQRDGTHLEYKTTISFKECLLGCERTIRGHPNYPDGFQIQIPIGTQNQEIVLIREEGMPIVGTGAKGDLRVVVTVVAGPEEKKILENNKAILQSLFATA
jgi:DnaJ-class molecular chaperone